EDVILKRIEIFILPIINFNNFNIGENKIIENDDKYIIRYETEYEYFIKVKLEIANIQDEYTTFAINNYFCDVDLDKKEIIINSNKISLGILYRIKLIINDEKILKNNGYELDIGNILFLKKFRVNFNKSIYLLEFLNPLEENRPFILKKIQDQNKIKRAELDIEESILQIFGDNIKIFTKTEKERKLEFLKNYFKNYSHIFILTQYDFIFHPNIANYIDIFEKNYEENYNINILSYPCPTNNLILEEENFKKLKQINRKFYLMKRLTCPNCKLQEYYFLYYDQKGKNCGLFCKNCNSLPQNHINSSDSESYQIYIPILNYIQIYCKNCNSPMICAVEKNKSNVSFICMECGKVIKKVNIFFNKYMLGSHSLSILSLNQFNYLLKNSLIFPLMYNQKIKEIKQKIYNSENLEKLLKFMNYNYPKLLNDKINEYKDYLYIFKDAKNIDCIIEEINEIISQIINNNKQPSLKKQKIKNPSKKSKNSLKKFLIKIKRKEIWNFLKKTLKKLKKSTHQIKNEDNNDEYKQTYRNKLNDLIEILLQTSFGKDLKFLWVDFNNLNVDSIKSLQKLKENINFQYKNSEYFKNLKKIREIKKEIDFLLDEWKSEIYLQFLKIIEIEQDINIVLEDISNFIDFEDEFNIEIDISGEDYDSTENYLYERKYSTKILNNVIEILKRKKLIDEYLKPLNFKENFEILKNLTFNLNEKRAYNKIPKFLFIFDDFSTDFNSNFSFDVGQLNPLLNKFKNSLENLQNNFNLRNLGDFMEIILYLT
ncbi:MAG: hypothetical protein ACTSVV_12315, partial [Promethearchaeota archaeon]